MYVCMVRSEVDVCVHSKVTGGYLFSSSRMACHLIDKDKLCVCQACLKLIASGSESS